MDAASETRGVKVGVQDQTGEFTWFLPSIREALQASWGPDHNIDEILPVPMWAQVALQAAVPLGTNYQPVPSIDTQHLQGRINDQEYQFLAAQSEISAQTEQTSQVYN